MGQRGRLNFDGAAPILGLSADYHDAAAALVVDGEIVAAAAEERFTRTKHDPSLPVNALTWCLEDAGVVPGGLVAVAFYSKPLTVYERIVVSHGRAGPRSLPSLARAMVTWSSKKLWVRQRIDRALERLGHRGVPVLFAEHHQSHAASAYYPSPFDDAAIVTLDGVGEWATGTIAHGRGNTIEMREQTSFPNSLGLFYSTMTAWCGFEVNDGEYKLMGLAPYGVPRYSDRIRDEVVRLSDGGHFTIEDRWFDFQSGQRMGRPRLAALLDGGPRPQEQPLGQREADIAASTQEVVEEVVLAVARRAHRLTGSSKLTMAGGVALNCVANGRLIDEGPFDDIWVQPAAGDDGGALGAALWACHQLGGRPRPDRSAGDAMRGAFLGPAFAPADVRQWLLDSGVAHTVPEDLEGVVADELSRGRMVAWFTGAMEFGPRALGHRSVLADPRDPRIVAELNLRVKGREGFRPFAPAVLAEHVGDWFEPATISPYMLRTMMIRPTQRRDPEPLEGGSFADQLSQPRSSLPACTHVDYSARVQTVTSDQNPEFHRLLTAFYRKTGCPVLLNTSLNRAGEPIVRSPYDALNCFVATGLDLLALEGCLVRREDLREGAT